MAECRDRELDGRQGRKGQGRSGLSFKAQPLDEQLKVDRTIEACMASSRRKLFKTKEPKKGKSSTFLRERKAQEGEIATQLCNPFPLHTQKTARLGRINGREA